jgi:hypothetical protein
LRSVLAPVNAPLTWPKSSLSSRSCGMAAQFSVTKGPFARLLKSCSARAEFLAGAALASHEHRRVGRSGALNDAVDRLHLERFADEAGKMIANVFLLHRGQLIGELAPVQRIANRDAQAVTRARLHHEVERAFAHRLDRQIDRSLAGDDDHFDRDVARFDLPQDVEPVHVRQLHVEQDDAWRRFVDGRQRRGAGFENLDAARRAVALQIALIGFRYRRHVFDNVDGRSPGAHRFSLCACAVMPVWVRSPRGAAVPAPGPIGVQSPPRPQPPRSGGGGRSRAGLRRRARSRFRSRVAPPA